jgi:predicted CXXCH cytochrome family protein
MKRTLLIAFGCALVAAGAWAQVAGTAHDLRGTIGGSQICVACHTPHGASPAVPLWNHSLPSPANTYTVYTGSATIDATDLADFLSSDGSVSSLCLSCHDGTVALGSLVNDPGDLTDTASTIGAVDANLGTDLTNDHPVNFTFDAALIAADGQRQAPTNAILFGPGSDQVQCGSCHDPHDATNVPFLVTSNAGSALCLDCHVK